APSTQLLNTHGNASAHNSRRRSLYSVWARNIPRHIAGSASARNTHHRRLGVSILAFGPSKACKTSPSRHGVLCDSHKDNYLQTAYNQSSRSENYVGTRPHCSLANWRELPRPVSRTAVRESQQEQLSFFASLKISLSIHVPIRGF